MGKKSNVKMGVACGVIITGLGIVSQMNIELVSIGTGVIDVNNSALQIKAPSTGYVSKLYVEAGSKVSVGDPLISFANQDLIFKEKSLKQGVSDLTERRKSLSVDICATTNLMGYISSDTHSFSDVYNACSVKKGQYSSVDAFVWKCDDFQKYSENVDNLVAAKKTQFKMIDKNIGISERKVERMKNHGAVKLQVESAEQELNTQMQTLTTNQTDVMKLNMERSSRKTALFNEFSQKMIQSTGMLEKTINTYDATVYELQLYDLKIAHSTIHSPVNGAVLSVEQNVGNGYYLGESEPIMILKKTSDDYDVATKFNSKYRSSIHVGTKVKLQPSLLGVRDTFKGVITHISEDSFSDDKGGVKRAGTRYYKVNVKPDHQINVSSGTEVTAYAISDKISVSDYLLSVFEQNRPVFEDFRSGNENKGK